MLGVRGEAGQLLAIIIIQPHRKSTTLSGPLGRGRFRVRGFSRLLFVRQAYRRVIRDSSGKGRGGPLLFVLFLRGQHAYA